MLKRLFVAAAVSAALLVSVAAPAAAGTPVASAAGRIAPNASGGGCAGASPSIGVSACISWATGLGLAPDLYIDNNWTIPYGAEVDVYLIINNGPLITLADFYNTGPGHYGPWYYRPTEAHGNASIYVYFEGTGGSSLVSPVEFW